MTEQNTPAGWYYMQGDPPGTHRWWDGVQWTGEPQQVAQAPAQQSVTPVQQPAVQENPFQQPAMAAQQPVAAGAAAQSSGVEYGSMLTNDLDAYWASMEDPVDPAAAFADTSSWDQDPEDGEGSDPEGFPQRPPATSEGGGGSASPIAWALLPLRKYAKFSGRSCRAEYWWFYLLNFVVGMAFQVSFIFAVPSADPTAGPSDEIPSGLLLVLGAMFLFSMIVAIPTWAVTIRRLHDTGRSGWTMLIGLIPILGWIWMLVVLATPGNAGWNKYGDDHIRP